MKLIIRGIRVDKLPLKLFWSLFALLHFISKGDFSSHVQIVFPITIFGTASVISSVVLILNPSLSHAATYSLFIELN